MKFELTILGTSAAVPYRNRYLSGQVLNVHDELFLIDCGEGTQFRMAEFQVKKMRINHIFITHLTVGYLFREKTLPHNILAEKIAEHNIPFAAIKAIKNGADFTNTEGTLIPNSELTTPPPKPRSFAYCSDTAYFEALIPHIQGVDLLYHEATFGHEMAAHATITGHSTAYQAGLIAQKAAVGQLIIGHFSSRYENLEPLLAEAKNAFEKTVLGIDGQVYAVELHK